ncbi:MAG: hypothetical protein KDK51_09630 [Deltaproteobacteria bacterium]|nr:hypothetical protein [Deltaproteobacteria bacterium]
MTQNEHIKQKLQTYPQDLFESYLENLLQAMPGPFSYIVGYGSCLSQTTQSDTSVPDFYVVVHDYKTFYSSWKAKQLNRHLPPNIYHFYADDVILKYCVISRDDLLAQVQIDAPDVYHMGRFSKRIALVYKHDEDALEHLLNIHTTAMRSAFTLSHRLLGPSADLDQAIEKTLALSYIGDVRIEADDKVKKIYSAEKQYYQEVYAPLLEEWNDQDPRQEKDEKLSFWIRKSRIRARMRWIKNVITASSWIDYMLFKIERTKGIKLEVTERQKKFWFISIWPILWKFQRDKIIK